MEYEKKLGVMYFLDNLSFLCKALIIETAYNRKFRGVFMSASEWKQISVSISNSDFTPSLTTNP